MAKNEVRAVELIRRIRAFHAETLRNASAEERIRFYRDKARTLDPEVKARRRQETPATD